MGVELLQKNIPKINCEMVVVAVVVWCVCMCVRESELHLYASLSQLFP